jgi:hypothetical protein
MNREGLSPEAKKYVEYIDFHRGNVEKARELIGDSLCAELHILPKHLEEVVSVHDMSRYETEEFDLWRQYKFPDPGKKPDKELYMVAKRHHWSVNGHHPEHWINADGTVRPMELVNVAEMLCDWTSEVVFEDHKHVKQWYYAQMKKEPYKFHPDTQHLVERLLAMSFIP